MKIRLLNSDGYFGMEHVRFPVEVDAVVDAGGKALVSCAELYRIGSKPYFGPSGAYCFTSSSWEAAE